MFKGWAMNEQDTRVSPKRLGASLAVAVGLILGAIAVSNSTTAAASTNSPRGQTSLIEAGGVRLQSIDPSQATFNPCVTPLCGIAIVDGATGRVHGVIVGSGAFAGTQTRNEYMGCPPGCWHVVQGQQTPDGNVAGWHGPDVIYDFSTRIFSLPGGGTLVSGARMDEVVYGNTTTIPSSSTSSPTTSATTTIVGSTTTIAGGGSSPTVSATTTSTTSTMPTTTAPTTGVPGSDSTSGSVQPNLARCITSVCGYAVVSSTGRVHGVIVCADWCTGQTMKQEYMGCPPGCRLIVQGQQTSDGNVAGWHGADVSYDDITQRFSLPGGGWIQSGARMDDAYFPPPLTTPPGADGGSSPTSSATTPIDGGTDSGTTTTFPQPIDDDSSLSGATTTVAYMSSSGVVHLSLADFIWFETSTLVSPIWIGLELPAIDASQVSYRTFFDPAGIRPLYLVGQGSFVDSNVSIMSGGGRVSVPPIVLVDRKLLRSSRGLLIVEVSTGGRVVGYAASSIGAVRSYSSCAQLRLDYPGGVSFGPGVVNVVSPGERVGPIRRPVAHQSLYIRNARLDTDRDLIACEP